jgi:hypothetical protein
MQHLRWHRVAFLVIVLHLLLVAAAVLIGHVAR